MPSIWGTRSSNLTTAYEWSNSGLDWSDGDKVLLALSASSDATLSALALDATPVAGFAPDKLDYAVTVPVGTTQITVEPTVNERGALVAFLDADDAALADADDDGPTGTRWTSMPGRTWSRCRSRPGTGSRRRPTR